MSEQPAEPEVPRPSRVLYATTNDLFARMDRRANLRSFACLLSPFCVEWVTHSLPGRLLP